jgi:hypothetical protein
MPAILTIYVIKELKIAEKFFSEIATDLSEKYENSVVRFCFPKADKPHWRKRRILSLLPAKFHIQNK